MQSAKEKVSNMASAAKEKIDTNKAKLQEKAAKVGARTEEEKVIAHEKRKVKEAEAKAELHASKALHAAEKLEAKQTHHQPHLPGTQPHLPATTAGHHQYGGYDQTGVVGGVPPSTTAHGATNPTYNVGGHPHTGHRNKFI